VSAPVVWNSLPTELRSTSVSRETFKSRLEKEKTHFYFYTVSQKNCANLFFAPSLSNMN